MATTFPHLFKLKIWVYIWDKDKNDLLSPNPNYVSQKHKPECKCDPCKFIILQNTWKIAAATLISTRSPQRLQIPDGSFHLAGSAASLLQGCDPWNLFPLSKNLLLTPKIPLFFAVSFTFWIWSYSVLLLLFENTPLNVGLLQLNYSPFIKPSKFEICQVVRAFHFLYTLQGEPQISDRRSGLHHKMLVLMELPHRCRPMAHDLLFFERLEVPRLSITVTCLGSQDRAAACWGRLANTFQETLLKGRGALIFAHAAQLKCCNAGSELQRHSPSLMDWTSSSGQTYWSNFHRLVPLDIRLRIGLV